jgi:hypothetical protein
MKKNVVISLVFVSIIFLFFTFTPNVLSQSENAEVLSYSWYGSQFGYFIVVGEVQNVGPNIIDYIYLGGIIYTTDEQAQAVSYTKVFSSQILPQQKAPFRMYFFPENSYTGDFSWLSIGIDHVEFGVVGANETDTYQYQNLEIANSMSYIDSYGLYTVTGSIRNTGNQATGRVWVVATFYNVSGNVIAVGYTNYLTPNSILPDQTTSFTVTPLDSTPQLANQITNYALIIQTESPIIPEFQSFIILPLFMVATLLTAIVYRRLLKKASE